MDRKGKQKSQKDLTVESVENEEEEEYANDDEKKRKSASGSSNPNIMPVAAVKRGGVGGGVACQAEKCAVDLSEGKKYHRRHKVCEAHSKAPAVIVGGLRQRFCQQCSRFHELSEFDDTKRSCRRRLAGHNERRRKSSSESQGEGSSRCRQADQGGTDNMQISLPGSPAYKHFQIR